MNFLSIATTIAVVGLTGLAHAATFKGTSGGTWRTDDVGSATNSCLFSTNDGADAGLAWGSPKTNCPHNGRGQDDSYVILEEFMFEYDITEPEKVQIGKLQWRNESTSRNTTKDFAAVADFFLNLSDPVTTSETEALAFNIDNTSNVGNGTADKITGLTWSNYGLGLPITFDGLEITGFSFELLGPKRGAKLKQYFDPYTGDVTFKWINKEGKTSHLGIFAHVQPAVVPLPATALLTLTGIGGLALLRRRVAV